MRHALIPGIVTSLVTISANADFLGWTSTVREVEGGVLVDVFAVTNSAGDRLVSVYGGRPSRPGTITTTASGGFLQAAGLQGAFKPGANQTWNDLDSFLTIGGGFDSGSASWTPDATTLGDPGWLFTASDGSAMDGFSTLPSTPGATNPWLNQIPAGAGWYATGPGSIARNLGSISLIRLGYSMIGGVRYGASSAAAAAGSYGMLVAQLFVADLEHSAIDWNMGATIRRSNGTAQQGEFAFTITQAPAPGAAPLLLALAGCRRRRR